MLTRLALLLQICQYILFALKYSIVLLFYYFAWRRFTIWYYYCKYLVLQCELKFCVGFHYINNNLEKVVQLDWYSSIVLNCYRMKNEYMHSKHGLLRLHLGVLLFSEAIAESKIGVGKIESVHLKNWQNHELLLHINSM